MTRYGKWLACCIVWLWGCSVCFAQAATLPDPPPFTSGRATFEEQPELFSFTPTGVLLTFRSGKGWYHNPLNVARYTVTLYASWKTQTESVPLFDRMMANARWLSDNAVDRVDPAGLHFLVYEYDFPLPQFATPPGWSSALTNAAAITALFVATAASGIPSFATQATFMLRPFDLTLANGGFRTILADRATVWYEEVAHPAAPSVRILNGHIYAMTWLRWYGEQAPNSQAQRLARQGMRGLQYALHLYDDNGFSVYDLYNRTHNCVYHKNGHIPQMKFLYETTGVELFDIYATRWAGTPCG